MIARIETDRIGVLVSGGLDSCILVGHLARAGHWVQPFHIVTDVNWNGPESASLEEFLAAIRTPGLQPLVTLEMPLADLYGQHWSIQGRDVPGAESPDEAVFLPGRNALLALKAAIWCQMRRIPTLALASLGSSPFADARPPFFRSLGRMLEQSGPSGLDVIAPFADLAKQDVMKLGAGLPLHHTFSCVGPRQGFHCGRCNKCAERRRAFALVDRPDPTRYLDAESPGNLPVPSAGPPE